MHALNGTKERLFVAFFSFNSFYGCNERNSIPTHTFFFSYAYYQQHKYLILSSYFSYCYFCSYLVCSILLLAYYIFFFVFISRLLTTVNIFIFFLISSITTTKKFFHAHLDRTNGRLGSIRNKFNQSRHYTCRIIW